MAGFDADVFGSGSGFDADVFSTTTQQPKPLASIEPRAAQGTGSAALDSGNAVGTGYWRGMARLAGVPVDTLMNVLDLGKAAIGAPYIAATGKAPPAWLEPSDRSRVVGTGDNIIESARKTSVGHALLDAANPDYQGGFLQAAGSGLTALMNPASARQAINQGLLGVTSATGGKAAYDLTGDPALAAIASMAPLGAQQAVTAGTKYAVRGGEEGRRQMEQRIQDLKNAGVENPTLGLASGNRLIGGVENILQSTPGAVGTMGRARNEALAGLQAKTEDAAALSSFNRGTLESGTAIQNGIKGFRDVMKGQQEKLYNELDTWIDPQHPATVGATKAKLAELNADIKGAPELSKQFKNARIQSIEDAILKDSAGAPQSVQVYPQPEITGVRAVEAALKSGKALNTPVAQPPIQVVIPEGPPRNTLPFEALKKARTLVGNEIADNTIVGTVPNSKWRPLYGAMSQDIGTTAQQVAPQAERAFTRANDYTSAAMGRLERVAPFAQTTAPEQAFTAMERAARENVSTLQAVKKTLTPDARGQVAGTIIERLGKATNANAERSRARHGVQRRS
jgi:hypothetical protein